ncbi:MAG: hypothetical protein IPK15_07000 [Verrucomicrobia bacterium]|nr:hypothetical protein [Verrucomicrobiota bacterium]
MSNPPVQPPPLPPASPPPSPEQTLRRLFLTLFLRGRGARGLKKEKAPKSVGSKLATTLVLYALFGCLALTFLGQPLFALSAYLHAMTLMFVGMFVASSSGEVLFNKEEADILMHRPVTPRSLLWAKIGVLVQVSLWLACAFNLAGIIAGSLMRDGGVMFVVAHLFSTVLLALFCTGSVVLVYQLCLRWFGRERLDALMTTAQVVMAIGMVMAGQLVPQLMVRLRGQLAISPETWWVWALPPAWFAGFDIAFMGRSSGIAWALAATGVVATALVLWTAFGRLANDYGAGLQRLNEMSGPPERPRAKRRWLDRLSQMPPLSWWLKDSVSRATFVLVAAYLVRDRDVKLRVYPGLAPMLIMPLIFLVRGTKGDAGSFGAAFSGTYIGLVPLLGISLLQYSQQWQAADVFRTAPLPGPAPLNRGLRRAVLLLLTVPVMLLYATLTWVASGSFSHLALLLPGVIAMPLCLIGPCLNGTAIPFSQPADEAKSAGRGLHMILFLVAAAALTGISIWAWSGGWFVPFLVGETVAVAALYLVFRAAAGRAKWSPMD